LTDLNEFLSKKLIHIPILVIYNFAKEYTEDNDSGPRFRGFPPGTRGKTPENGREVEAIIR